MATPTKLELEVDVYAKHHKQKVLVVLSGGQDSTTCLFMALARYGEVHAVTFDYGQRHACEIQAAKKIAEMAGLVPGKTHEIIDVRRTLAGTSPLVSDNPVGQYKGVDALPGGLEDTFVPARNILFLTVAANRAACLGIRTIITGLCQEDYGGYPDCRRDFVDAMEQTLGLGISSDPRQFEIETPLMNLTKAQSVHLAVRTPGAMRALAFSHTCYNGMYPPNPFNHASILRAKGFRDAGVPDPLIERARREGLLPAMYPEHGLVEGTPYADPRKWAEIIHVPASAWQNSKPTERPDTCCAKDATPRPESVAGSPLSTCAKVPNAVPEHHVNSQHETRNGGKPV